MPPVTLGQLRLVGGIGPDGRPREDALIDALWLRLRQEAKVAYAHAPMLAPLFVDSIINQPSLEAAAFHRIAAVVERDPACIRFIEPFLYFKGFHALQTHRLAHWLWNHDERDFALYLQSRSSDVFQTDIHPAARFGKGVFLDHATGLVVGETAMIGAGAKILGNIEIGAGARVAAGSVVLRPVEAGATVAGVPAKPVNRKDGADDLGYDYSI